MLFIFALSVKGWIESLFSCSRIEPRNAVDPGGEKKVGNFFCQFFSKSRGRPSSRCRSVSGRPIALLRVDLAFDPIEKKVKIFLSPVAGQLVDVGASRAGGAALLRVDLAFDPIEKKVRIFLSPVAGQAVDVGASRAGRLPCSESISLSIRSKKKK